MEGRSASSTSVDYVNGHKNTYDDHGHGTHVAGIIGGNGFDSAGARSGIAPAASLVVLKVLDKTGRGRVSDVIAALDHVVAIRSRYNIRVVNLSVAAAVLESYDVDPLTVAARRAVEAGHRGRGRRREQGRGRGPAASSMAALLRRRTHPGS